MTIKNIIKFYHLLIIIIAIAALFGSCDNTCSNKKNEQEMTEKIPSQIFPKGEIINNDYLSGTAWLQMLVADKEKFDLTVGNVIFEPGVRNNWHSHPGGQILLCIKGIGYYQEKGKPIQLLNVGNVVEILPNVIHWHGATPDNEFEHIAISPQSHKGSVVWLQAVTDEEYNSFRK